MYAVRIHVCSLGDDMSGHMLIDDEFLRAQLGYTDADLVKYRCDPEVEPPRLLANENVSSGFFIKRGDVSKVTKDVSDDSLAELSESSSGPPKHNKQIHSKI